MKPLIITLIILTPIILILNIAKADETLSGQLKVNFQDETASYSETYDFSDEYETKTSATVIKSDCLKCLDYYHITDCQARGECLDVIIN